MIMSKGSEDEDSLTVDGHLKEVKNCKLRALHTDSVLLDEYPYVLLAFAGS